MTDEELIALLREMASWEDGPDFHWGDEMTAALQGEG